MKQTLFTACCFVTCLTVQAQIPVTDVASIASNQLAHVENIAKWATSIEQLKFQIEQLKQQVAIQTDLRRWAGDPKAAAGRVLLDKFGAKDLLRDYGRSRASILIATGNLDSLKNTAGGIYRLIENTDLEGGRLKRDELAHRRYAVLEAQEKNFQDVVVDTSERETELEEDLSETLQDLKDAGTDAEVTKQTAKIQAISGQLAALSAKRRDQADQVVLQKVANDTRLEEERLAAAELEAKNDTIANQRVTRFMQKIKIGKTTP